MTTAFVLSGGGIRGPLHVGALQSLLEHGIQPDFFVGTSAGSLNAAFLAAQGAELAAIPGLQAAWRKGSAGVVYPGNILTVAWRFISGKDGAFASEGMRKLIQDNLPPGVTTFGQLKCPAYLTSVDLSSSRLYLFGEDPSAPLIDAMMASSSIPVLQPPVDYHGLQLVDGGVVAGTPISVAIDKGADTIYAVNLGQGEERQPAVHGMFNILERTLGIFLVQSLYADLKRADEDPNLKVHYIHITDFAGLPFNDFKHIEEQFVAGKRATDAYLANPAPRAVFAATRRAVLAPQVIGGAREYVASWMVK
jgi:NTE family protein